MLSSPSVIPSSPSSALTFPLGLDRVVTWEVYRRLQDLSIPCQCGVHQPLTVTAATPLALAQVWSVVKTQTAPRADQVAHLNRCWQQRNSK